jgi:uncharacterized protein
MRVWVDLSNSPHPLLFEPIARRLDELGHETLVTARDNAQTVELTLERWPHARIIGDASPTARREKAAAIARRVRDLTGWARRARPHVALSHNSYAQIVAARALGIPTVTAMDYEGQPANHLGFRLARRILLPEPLKRVSLRGQGVTARKARWYPGLKEDLYLGSFEPDPHVVERLGVERDDAPLVVARTPPSRAAYHRFGNPLFEAALRQIGAQPEVRCVVLARHPEQRSALHALGMSNLVVPQAAVDSRSLMYAADLVLGAGGTMTREAALLGVPTLTVFAGEPPAVDRWLEREGRLRRLEDARQLAAVAPRQGAPAPVEELRRRAQAGREAFVAAVAEAAG